MTRNLTAKKKRSSRINIKEENPSASREGEVHAGDGEDNSGIDAVAPSCLNGIKKQKTHKPIPFCKSADAETLHRGYEETHQRGYEEALQRGLRGNTPERVTRKTHTHRQKTEQTEDGPIQDRKKKLYKQVNADKQTDKDQK